MLKALLTIAFLLLPQAAIASPQVRERDVLELVRQEAVARLQVPKNDINVAWQDMAIVNLIPALPPGKVSFQVSKTASLGGTGSVPVQVLVNGQKFRTIFPRLNIQVMRSVLVSKRRIPRGGIPQTDDLEWVRKPLGHHAQAPLTDLTQVVGNESTQDILPGTVLAARMFKIPTLVKMGEEVGVTVMSGGLTIVSRGQARSAGGIGQLVKVVNLDTKHEFMARVTGPGKVELRLED
jgi:flagella basal body P-ring formation protein FlgA